MTPRYFQLFFLICLALITTLSLIPATSIPDTVQFWDKAQHALGFAALAVMGAYAFPNHIRLVVLGLLVYGALIEVLQMMLTTTRMGDLLDWFADAVGVLSGIILVYAFGHVRRKLV